jgi:hypothetical protein
MRSGRDAAWVHICQGIEQAVKTPASTDIDQLTAQALQGYHARVQRDWDARWSEVIGDDREK